MNCIKDKKNVVNSYISTIGIVLLLLIGLIVLLIIDVRCDTHISFSKESGYYDDAFELKIYGGIGNKIYYTLDGSDPTMDDFLYDAANPILIKDASENENNYSLRTDVTAAFLYDLVDAYATENPHYTVPDYKVEKCNVVRAAAFDEEGNCLDTIEGVYFVGFQKKIGFEGIYTASIVTDPSNLFDYGTGIYTRGITFDSFLQTVVDSEGNWSNPFWWHWYGNYHNGGTDWEREAVVDIFDGNRELVLSEKCGIRIQGGGSRGRLPKSIGCYARDIYEGSNKFRSDIFGTNIYPHKFVFFTGADDDVFKLKDYMANVMEKPLAFATMEFIPCTVFLDGEYWGVYYITENYNKDYISDHYNVRKENVIMIKSMEVTEGELEDGVLFEDMCSYISETDMSIEENYEEVCGLIDIDSYIDYYAAQIYIGRFGDWPSGNWAVWKTRENDGTAYGDCRWRWMLFDVNSGGLSIDQLTVDTLSTVLAGDTVFCSLFQNDGFRVRFAERILYIGKEIFSADKCNSFLDSYVQQMKEPIEIGNLRFFNDKRTAEFEQNVENTRAFFMGRYDMIWDFLVSHMGESWLNQNEIWK